MTNTGTGTCMVALGLCFSLAACGDDAGGDESVQGDATRGGQIYDAYWEVTGVLNPAEPATNNPLWAVRPDMASNTRTGPDTWRCKECHGWDYKGASGRYATGGHATGIKGVLGTTLTADQIITALSDPAGHGYGAVLSQQDLQDVTAFIKTKLIDTSAIINANSAFMGDAATGQGTFSATCAECHGPDGTNPMPLGSMGGFDEFPGILAKDNPWEFAHKVRFGQPGTPMPPQEGVLDLAGVTAVGAYAQTMLPGPAAAQ